MKAQTKKPNGYNHDVNNYKLNFKGQRWLVAHNGWNTNQKPPNQIKTITELLDYGVRGFALDIYADKNGGLHLDHGAGIDSKKDWLPIRDELKAWLEKNPYDVVSLFFESYLSGPARNRNRGMNASRLATLDATLREIDCYKSGSNTQVRSMGRTLEELVTGKNAFGEQIQGLPHRLFAFIERRPDEGKQSLFPEMTAVFAENMYGDASLRMESWVDFRSEAVKPNYANKCTFMNHFGNSPTGSEWTRNKPGLLIKHAQAFAFRYAGKYPNFISLDKINWRRSGTGEDKLLGPQQAASQLKYYEDFYTTTYKWENSNDCDDYAITMGIYPHSEKPVVSFSVDTAKGQGITKIKCKRGDGPSVTEVQVYNQPGYGIVNLRYKVDGAGWSNWLTPFETPSKANDTKDSNLGIHKGRNGKIVGFCCRTQNNRGVTDFVIASPL